MESATLNLRRADEPAATSVLPVDDQPAFRDAVRELVEATSGMVVVGEADSGERALELVEQLRPDLVLMDVRMPGIGGVGATRMIKKAHPSAVVVLVSTAAPEELPAEAGDCLADALVWKGALRPALLEELWLRHRPREQPASLS